MPLSGERRHVSLRDGVEVERISRTRRNLISRSGHLRHVGRGHLQGEGDSGQGLRRRRLLVHEENGGYREENEDDFEDNTSAKEPKGRTVELASALTARATRNMILQAQR